MQRQITTGTTDVSVTVRIVDSSDGTPEEGVTSATGGLNLWYRREGAAVVNLTESDLSALTDAHSDGGMLHIDDGYYRIDVPDAAFASGSTGVLIGGSATGMIVIGAYIQLVAINLNDGVRAGLTALPNAAADAAGGLPISDAGGLDLDAQIGTDIDNLVSRLGTPSDLGGGASVAANLSDIEAQTDDIGAAGAGLTAVPWNAAWDAEVESEVADALAVYDPPTHTELISEINDVQTDIAALNDPTAAEVADAVWDESTVGHTTAGTFGEQLKSDVDAILVDTNELQTDDVPGLIAALNNLSAAQVNTEVDTALADIHLDHLLAADYDPASKPGTATALLNELIESDAGVSRFTANALEEAPSGTGASAATIADAVWDEAIAGHVAAGSFGEEVQAHALSSEVSALNDFNPTTETVNLSAATETQIDAIEADTNELQGDWTNGGRLDLLIDAILGDTGTDIPALIAALNDLDAATVNAQVVDALATDTYAEPAAVPAATATLAAKIGWLYLLARNKVTQTGTTQTVFADDTSTSVAASTVSDDSTTATRGEWT